jgi:hypothetical protein
MRVLLVLSLLSSLAAATAVPVVTRVNPQTLRYDVHATDPWMPLLWETLSVTLPVPGPCGIRILVDIYDPGDGYSVSNTDLLTLRTGNGVVLDGLHLNVDGLDGTWSGLTTGTTQLTATLPNDATVEHAFLLLRQIYFGNLRGIATDNRRVRFYLEQIVGGTTTRSAASVVNLTMKDAESLPLLRFDPVSLTVGVTSALRPVAWYDSRPATPLTWLLLTKPPNVLHIIADNNDDVSQTLINKPDGTNGYPITDFTNRDLQLHVDITSLLTLSFRCFNSTDSMDAKLTITATGAAIGGMMIGDLPLAVTPGVPSSVELCTSQAGTWLVSIEPHNQPDYQPPNSWFSLTETSPGHQQLTITAENTERKLLTGILVLTNGSSVVRLPFRIVSDPGGNG